MTPADVARFVEAAYREGMKAGANRAVGADAAWANSTARKKAIELMRRGAP